MDMPANTEHAVDGEVHLVEEPQQKPWRDSDEEGPQKKSRKTEKARTQKEKKKNKKRKGPKGEKDDDDDDDDDDGSSED